MERLKFTLNILQILKMLSLIYNLFFFEGKKGKQGSQGIPGKIGPVVSSTAFIILRNFFLVLFANMQSVIWNRCLKSK